MKTMHVLAVAVAMMVGAGIGRTSMAADDAGRMTAPPMVEKAGRPAARKAAPRAASKSTTKNAKAADTKGTRDTAPDVDKNVTVRRKAT